MKKQIINIVIFCLLGVLGFGLSLALAGEQVQKTRSCHINVIVRWNIEEGNKVIEGSLNLTVNGTLKLSEQLKNPISKMYGNINYEIEHLDMSYSYREKTTDKDPSFCLENPVLEEWSASGTYRFGGGAPSGAGLYIRNIGTMSPPASMVKGVGAEEFLAMLQAQAPQVVTNYYEFMGYGTPPEGVEEPIIINGRVRKNDCTFRDSTKKLSSTISLRFKIPEDGKLKGKESWSAKYSGGMSMFKIGLSDLPETMEKEPYKPAKVDSGGDITYQVSWSFEELKPEVRIYRVTEGGEGDLKDITDMEEETIIGEKINLVAIAQGLADYEINEAEWKIDGKYIKDYKASLENTELDKKVNLESDEVTFAWIKGDFSGKSMQVEVKGEVGGKDVTGKTTFKVYAPKITGRKIRCSSTVTLGERFEIEKRVQRESLDNVSCEELDADPEKYFDNLNRHCSVYPGLIGSVCDWEKIEKAFTAEYTVEMPWLPDQGYAVQYVQLIMENSTETNFDKITKETKNSQWCIDTSYPYAQKRLTFPSTFNGGSSSQSKTGEGSSDSCTAEWCRISMEDTPGLPLEQGSIKVLLNASIKHSFNTYLMFRPSSKDSEKTSIWVPLAMVTWGWSADVKRLVDWKENIPCNEAYEILTSSPPSKSYSHSANPDYPEWDCNVQRNDRE